MTGLFRVIDPGMGLPSIFDAVYWYTEDEAKDYAIRVWNYGYRMRAPLFHYVAPGEDAKSVPVDYEYLRSTPLPSSSKLDEVD